MIKAGNTICIPAYKRKELTAPVCVEPMLPMNKWFYNLLSERIVGLVFRGIFANFNTYNWKLPHWFIYNCEREKKLTILYSFYDVPNFCIKKNKSYILENYKNIGICLDRFIWEATLTQNQMFPGKTTWKFTWKFSNKK